jgi:hypothetical protein
VREIRVVDDRVIKGFVPAGAGSACPLPPDGVPLLSATFNARGELVEWLSAEPGAKPVRAPAPSER